jgi:hypothetical protein
MPNDIALPGGEITALEIGRHHNSGIILDTELAAPDPPRTKFSIPGTTKPRCRQSTQC